MSLPERFTRVDELTRLDHHWLTPGDRCFFLGEYAARQGYAYSPTNNLLINFKKPMDRRGKPEWRYKEKAIREIASAFRRALAPVRRRAMPSCLCRRRRRPTILSTTTVSLACSALQDSSGGML